jgi:hypothetical protein
MQIPNGLQFYIPQLKWSAPPYSSMDFIARAVINLLNANPRVQAQLQWDLSIGGMMDRIDEYNAAVCLQRGFAQYVMAEGGQPDPPPFLGHPSQNPSSPSALAAAAGSLKKIWAGVRTLNEWLDAEAPAVSPEVSTSRSSVCVACPQNTAGDFTAWFTKPASEAIRRQLDKAKGRNLTTPNDEKLNVCGVCLCPMKLKVHVPLEYIRREVSDETLSQLRAVPGCWIARELAGS